MFKLLLFILLISLTFAQSLTGELNKYMPYIGIVGGISIIIISLAYMYGKFRNNPWFLMFYRDEMKHFLFTLALVGLAASLYIGLYAVFLEPTGGINTALNMMNVIDTQMRTSFTAIKTNEINYRKQGAEVNIAYGLEGIDTPPFINSYNINFPSNPEAEIKANIYASLSLNVINIIVGSIYLQKAILSFISSNIFLSLFFIGIMLRFIPSFREAGNLLISAFFGFYFVYPMIYVMFYQSGLSSMGVVDDICNGVKLSFVPCGMDGFIGITFYSVIASFLPSLAIGTTLIFISNFKKVFDLEVV